MTKVDIELINVGKKFGHQWIFKGINKTLRSGGKYAITGSNGSGKSTLLQVILGNVIASQGKVSYMIDEKHLDSDVFFRHVSIAAPYLELIEEYTLTELLNFHFKLKGLRYLSSTDELIKYLYLENSRLKSIKQFSSGMKQRLKLGLSFFSDSSVLLLDEPTSNLDEPAAELYREMIDRFTSDRLVLVASNQKSEYSFCDEEIYVSSFR